MREWSPEGEAAAWWCGEWSRRRVWCVCKEKDLRDEGALDWGKCKHGNCMISHAGIGLLSHHKSMLYLYGTFDPDDDRFVGLNLDFSPAMCELSRLFLLEKWLSPSHARPFSLRRVHGITICKRIIFFLFFGTVIISMPYPALPV